MSKKMEFDVHVFLDPGMEEWTGFEEEVTEEEYAAMVETERDHSFLNEVPRLQELAARLQRAACDSGWVPFEDEEAAEGLDFSLEDFFVSYPKEIVRLNKGKEREYRSKFLLKGLRCGYDGGGVACGPVEGAILAEAMVKDADGRLLFVLLERFQEYAKVTLSRTPLFDILMELPDWDVNWNREKEILKKSSRESWEFEHYAAPGELMDSPVYGVVKLLFLAERACSCSERGEDFAAAQKLLEEYRDRTAYALLDLELPDIQA